jgi:acyl carrier protein
VNDVQNRLARCFSAVFPSLKADVICRAEPATVSSWDSIATLNLLTVIEEEFNITIELEDFVGLISFRCILGYLEKRVSPESMVADVGAVLDPLKAKSSLGYGEAKPVPNEIDS